ncbi:hypothetical protein AAC387_Pa11g0438 [Persea americana]
MCILKKSYVREREIAHKCEASKETLASAEEVFTEVVVVVVAQPEGTSTKEVVVAVAQLEGTSKALARGHVHITSLKKSYVRGSEASKENLVSAEEVATEVVLQLLPNWRGHPRRPLRLLKRLPLLEAAKEVGTVQLEEHPRRLAAFELETSVVQEVAIAVEPVIRDR